jgi:rubrerythrin
VPADTQTILNRYMEDAIAAERGMQSQLESFASDGDDDDVKALFAEGARQAQSNADELTARIAGENPSAIKSAAGAAVSGLQRTAEFLHIQEERTVQHLIAAYSMEMSATGMYLALESVAKAANDIRTSQLAADAGLSASQLAAKLFHLIPTRSIIAYNMLTVTEIDPSVETKYREASWTG